MKMERLSSRALARFVRLRLPPGRRVGERVRYQALSRKTAGRQA